MLNKLWYHHNRIVWPLVPFSWVYTGIVKVRRQCYQLLSLLKKKLTAVPVIVVGNITVGGTGKTPLVIHIAEYLIEQGWQPGIISRGYKGTHRKPTLVNAKSDPKLVGDEAILLAKRLEDCPVVVGKNRVAALKHVLSFSVDVVISDDGLQHYALDRQIEIAVVDAERLFGNGFCLPAGPLRESEKRLAEVDLIIHNTGKFYDSALQKPKTTNTYQMGYRADQLYNAFQKGHYQTLTALHGQKVHAVAGIGNPDRFFSLLASFGLNIIKHPFPDHYRFLPRDIYFRDEFPVIMTEKDAVKCTKFVDTRHWVLPICANVDPVFDTKLLTLLEGQYYG